ncbi:N-acetylmuramoyl-L-alanine amidase [Luteimonas kalidii]|uniref:N-acetylmuramoyl-L-alanine amidase n=1 Tax=Luteimonas kalidii TaxID=3042025 RepID=A0ABT6JTL9_9GAMM|nr:N-acetylmuramoyl-L-alanine amidase [Luteimonas kalidii]MDH5834035.1 N-acetylmuramoyl-L-alanine amidase [Luteimonas kalidii]
MRTRGLNVQQILLGLALLAALVWNLAHAAELRAVQLDSGPTGTRAELQVDQEAEYRLIHLQNPDRLVVDLPGSRLAGALALPRAAGVVRSVRSGQPEPGTTRIVFDLAAPVVALKPRFEAGPGGTRLVIEWPDDGPVDPIAQLAAGRTASVTTTSVAATSPAAAPAAPSTTEAPPTAGSVPTTKPDPAAASAAATSRLVAELRAAGQAAPAPAPNPASPPQLPPTHDPSLPRAVPNSTPSPATVAAAVVPATSPVVSPPPAVESPPPPVRAVTGGTRPLVIAIDAGHGGQDPGAIGPSGKREKDITLAIARELARQVNATPGLRAHLVRDRDVFIPLNNRARLARQAKADMFISIHADAAENRNAKGSSVYVLSLRGASSQRARWLADKENAADLIGGVRAPSNDNVLTNVLLDLTQSGQMKASEDAGNHILSGLKRIGNNHKPHIERANFAVLRTSDMPAMLVETAFLSNPEEEKRLIDPKFQGTVARAILDGVHTYFSSQPPPGTLYAARAAGDRVASASPGGR